MAAPRNDFVAPTRDGVGASCIVLPAGDFKFLIDFLAQQFPAIGRTAWHLRMVHGDVLDASGVALGPDTRYQTQTKIFYYRSLPFEAPIPFEATIVFQDDYLIVADKPHFLPVIPAGRYLQQTLLVRLKRQLGIDTLAPVHRIDRETAGLVLFTIAPKTRAAYQALFRERRVVKHYEAIACHAPALRFPLVLRNRLEDAESFMQMRVVDGMPNAETTVNVLALQGDMARYGLRPSTGQRHQLRVQMAALGLPILHDKIYPQLLPEAAIDAAPDYSKPLQLLAKSLEFVDPVSGRLRRFESRLQLEF